MFVWHDLALASTAAQISLMPVPVGLVEPKGCRTASPTLPTWPLEPRGDPEPLHQVGRAGHQAYKGQGDFQTISAWASSGSACAPLAQDSPPCKCFDSTQTLIMQLFSQTLINSGLFAQACTKTSDAAWPPRTAIILGTSNSNTSSLAGPLLSPTPEALNPWHGEVEQEAGRQAVAIVTQDDGLSSRSCSATHPTGQRSSS